MKTTAQRIEVGTVDYTGAAMVVGNVYKNYRGIAFIYMGGGIGKVSR